MHLIIIKCADTEGAVKDSELPCKVEKSVIGVDISRRGAAPSLDIVAVSYTHLTLPTNREV